MKRMPHGLVSFRQSLVAGSLVGILLGHAVPPVLADSRILQVEVDGKPLVNEAAVAEVDSYGLFATASGQPAGETRVKLSVVIENRGVPLVHWLFVELRNPRGELISSQAISGGGPVTFEWTGTSASNSYVATITIANGSSPERRDKNIFPTAYRLTVRLGRAESNSSWRATGSDQHAAHWRVWRPKSTASAAAGVHLQFFLTEHA